MAVFSSGGQPSRITAARGLWFLAGCAAVALGAIGAVVPVLPTTPFVILGAYAFGKSSPRLQDWLESSAVFGPIIADWQDHGAIAPRYKTLAIVMMGTFFGFSVMSGFAPVVLAIQAVAMAAAAAFILTRPGRPIT